jgi:hypothetical protein
MSDVPGAEYYRRCGLVAKQRAEQSRDPRLKEAFKEVARHWLALAERADWLDRRHNGQDRTRPHTEGVEPNDPRKKAPGRVPTKLPVACRPVSTSSPQGLNGKRAGRSPGQGENL